MFLGFLNDFANDFFGNEAVLFLLYHRVAPTCAEFDLPAISPSVFEEQLRVLVKEYEVISLQTYLDAREHGTDFKKRGKRCVVITFDDGYKDNYTFAFPLLKKYHLPATFYIATGFIENSETRCVSDPEMHKRSYLTWDEIAEMAHHPLMQIGAHTVSHPRLTEQSYEQARREIERSKSMLETRLGMPVTTFAYPFGTARDVSEELMKCVKQLGFTSAVTTIHGSNPWMSNPMCLKRIEAGFHLPSFKRRLGSIHMIWYRFLFSMWTRVFKKPMNALRKKYPTCFGVLKRILFL